MNMMTLKLSSEKKWLERSLKKNSTQNILNAVPLLKKDWKKFLMKLWEWLYRWNNPKWRRKKKIPNAIWYDELIQRTSNIYYQFIILYNHHLWYFLHISSADSLFMNLAGSLSSFLVLLDTLVNFFLSNRFIKH